MLHDDSIIGPVLILCIFRRCCLAGLVPLLGIYRLFSRIIVVLSLLTIPIGLVFGPLVLLTIPIGLVFGFLALLTVPAGLVFQILIRILRFIFRLFLRFLNLLEGRGNGDIGRRHAELQRSGDVLRAAAVRRHCDRLQLVICIGFRIDSNLSSFDSRFRRHGDCSVRNTTINRYLILRGSGRIRLCLQFSVKEADGAALKALCKSRCNRRRKSDIIRRGKLWIIRVVLVP